MYKRAVCTQAVVHLRTGAAVSVPTMWNRKWMDGGTEKWTNLEVTKKI
jgi:hypothetical protein